MDDVCFSNEVARYIITNVLFIHNGVVLGRGCSRLAMLNDMGRLVLILNADRSYDVTLK